MEALADHLVSVGVKHPLVLDAPTVARAPGEPSTRGALLLDALRRRGYLPTHVVATAASADAGAAGTTAALTRHLRLDAVVAFNDVMALGALAACRRAHAEVPDRVRVIGIDGLTLGTLVAPTLTTLAVDLDEVARHAVDLALGMLDGSLPRSGPSVERVVRHRLVVRESA